MFNATTKVSVCDHLATQMFNFMPQPLATVTQMHTQWFMQDAAWPHTARLPSWNLRWQNVSLRISQRHECGHIWPHHSPDI